MSRRTTINLVFFLAVFGVMLVWAAQNIVTVDAIERPYEIAGDFEAAAGVLPESEVSYLGVRYGRVDSVRRTDDGVRITMKIERDKRIPEGSTANIFRKSAIGEPYVLFVPPAGTDGDGPSIEAGAVIPRERTTVPLEFSDMLRSASRLISAIPPDVAGDLVHELAVGLEGRGGSLRAMASASDTLAQTLVDRSAALDRLATNNTRLTRTVAEHRGSLGGAIADLRALADSLRRSEGDLLTLLDDGPDLLGRAADLVADNKANLDCILKDLEGVVDVTTTPEHLAGLRTVLGLAPDAFGGVWDSRDVEPDGAWVRVGLINNPTNPATQYLPPKELPPVPAVPPCVSSLAATGIDYTPLPRQPAPSPIPATGGELALMGGLLLLTAGVVAASVSRERA